MAPSPSPGLRSARLLAAAALAAAPAGIGAIAQAQDAPHAAPAAAGLMLVGTPGPDTLAGGPGADTLTALEGTDSLRGEAGDDLLSGNRGPDGVDGGDGQDTIHGGRGPDVLYGGAGNDWIVGELGDDTAAGGPGADRFVVGQGPGSDVILDFSSADGDRIALPPGATYAVADQIGGAVISLQGGGQVRLIGVSSANLGAWNDTPPAPLESAATPAAAQPAGGLRSVLGPLILALFAAFLVLAVLGVRELRRRERDSGV
jgi:hypothetical protein